MEIYKLENGDYNTVNLFNDHSDYQPRKKRILACNGNLTFYPDTLEAYSYGHWRFVQMVNGTVFFNMYNYSRTTSTHQYYIKNLLDSRGIKYVTLYTYKNLDETHIINQGLRSFYTSIFHSMFKLRTNINSKTRIKVLNSIEYNKQKIKELRSYGLVFNIFNFKRLYNSIKNIYATRYVNNNYELFFNYLGKYRITSDIKTRNRINNKLDKIKSNLKSPRTRGIKVSNWFHKECYDNYRKYYKNFNNTYLGRAING